MTSVNTLFGHVKFYNSKNLSFKYVYIIETVVYSHTTHDDSNGLKISEQKNKFG